MADREIRARLTYDVTQAQASLDQLGAKLDQLEKPITISANVSTNIAKSLALTKIKQEFTAFQNQAKQLERINITIKIDSTSIIAVKKELEKLSAQKPVETRILVDDSDVEVAEGRLTELARRAREIATGRGGRGVAVNVDDSQVVAADLTVTDLSKDLVSINKQQVTVNIDIDKGPIDTIHALPPSVNHLVEKFAKLSQVASHIPGRLGSIAQTATQTAGGFANMASGAGEAAGAAEGLAGAGEAAAAGIGAAGLAAGIAAAAIAGLVAGMVAGTAAFVGVGKAMEAIVDQAGPAGDLNEALNVTKLVFGEVSDEIINMSETASREFGLTQTEFLNLGRGSQVLLKGLGFTAKEAGSLVVQIAERARDLGSAFNISTQQAFEALQAGLRGEFERLETIGIPITALEVQNKALALGLATTTEEITQQDKALTLLKLATEKSADAAGDFANTMAESLPNQLKVARSQLGDIKTDFSKAFLPAALDILKTVNADILPQLRHLAQTVAPIIAGALRVLKPVFDFVLKAAQGLLIILEEKIPQAVERAVSFLEGIHVLPEGTAKNVRQVLEDVKAAIKAADLKNAMQEAFEGPSLDELIEKQKNLKFESARIGLEVAKQKMEDLKPVLSEVSAAITEAFAPKKFIEGVTIANALLEVAAVRQEILAKGGFTPVTAATIPILQRQGRLEAQKEIQEKINALLETRGKLAEQVLLGKVDPQALAAVDLQIAGFEKLIDRTGDLGKIARAEWKSVIDSITFDKVDFAKQRAELTSLEKQGVDAAGSLEGIVAFLKLNPKIESDLRINGLPEALKGNADVIKALGILDGSFADPTVDPSSIENAIKRAEGAAGKIKELDRITVSPTVTLDDARFQSRWAAITSQLASAAVQKVVIPVEFAVEQSLTDLVDRLRTRLRFQSLLDEIHFGFLADGGIITRPTLAVMGEGHKKEAVVPLTKPWERQKTILEDAGIIARLEAEFSKEEGSRVSALNAMMGALYGAAGNSHVAPSYDSLAAAIEKAVEKAATTVLERARPVKAEFHVPPTRNPDEQVRMILHKLRRM